MCIKDIEFSIPFNKHVWSDANEARVITDAILKIVMSQHAATFESKSNRKPLATIESQLRVILINLYYAWKIDPSLSLGVSMSCNEYQPTSRYNGTCLSFKVPQLINSLEKLGYIERSHHVFREVGSRENRRTRIRATKLLVSVFAKKRFAIEKINNCFRKEHIELRSREYENVFGAKPKSTQVDYVDSAATNEMREVLIAYNELLNANCIDVSIYPDQKYGHSLPNGKFITIPIVQGQHFVRRIFSRGSFDFGGRFYGGFWQQIPKEDRPYIRINGEKTVELDFNALHPRLLAAEKGLTIEGDPYDLGVDLLPEHLMYLHRKYVKKLLLVAINAKNRNEAYHALVESLPEELAKHYPKEMLKEGLKAIRQRHPFMADTLCSDAGIRLMRTDSDIVEHVLKRFIALETPVLPVHDSFIVQASKRPMLEEAMREASKAVTGVTLDFSVCEKGVAQEPVVNLSVISDSGWPQHHLGSK